MNSPFQLTDINNDWAVVWPSFSDKFTDRMKFNLLECVFKEIKCFEVGLGIADDGTEATIMWIKEDIFFSELTEEYTQYLYKYYHIGGVVFHELGEAEKFKEILEKRYVWQLLKE